MSYKFDKYCLHCSLIWLFMLLFQVSDAQYDFTKVDGWLNDNLNELGGRAVLMIYKNGKLIYSKAENDRGRRQIMAGKFIAQKTRKDPTLTIHILSLTGASA